MLIAAALAVIVSGLAIFVAPGAVVLAAAAVPLRSGERLAFAFAVSLALLTAAFAACLALGLSIDAAPAAVAVVTLFAAFLLGRFRVNCASTSFAPALAPAASQVLLALMTAAAVAAAVAFAPVGSVDRWWYLAYVRGWLDAPALSLAEPFLATGQTFARFGVHPWLFGLAAWSRMSGVDPVLVYERAAPVLVVLASVSAARSLATELFSESVRARLCVLATMLLWSGAALPLLARAGEDKVLAAAALLPLCLAAFLRVARAATGEARAAGLMLLFAACAATAAVHALSYAFALVALLPLAAVLALREPLGRRGIAAAGVVLVLVAIAPAVSGIIVRGRLHDIGAELAASDHPVVRVHEGRERLLDLPSGGYVVSPRLLAHPLSLLALLAVPLVLRRRAVLARVGPSAGAVDSTRAFVLVTLLVPLAIAFVPPLAVLAGSVIPPWMVYRVLWLLPLAPLAAIAAHWLGARFARTETVATLLLLLLGLPIVLLGAQNRLAEARERVAAPASAEFARLILAIRALPPGSLMVAAPELSERLPALTARHVVAALDRSTIVFSGSREAGEARLRARAALLAGDADAGTLEDAAGVHATHAVFDARAAQRPGCAKVLHSADAYALCELAPRRTQAVAAFETWTDAPTRSLAEGDCDEMDLRSRRDPWSAAAPAVLCRVPVPPGAQLRDRLLLRIDAWAGRAVDELRITLLERGVARAAATTRISASGSVVLRLPPATADKVELRIASSFLPFVKPLHVALVTE